MQLPDPRRIAAADMYGTHGSMRRRSIIRAEFVTGVIAGTALGILDLLGAGESRILGVWLLGAGANYLPLALEAQRLSRPGVLEAHMSGRETRRELRWAGRAQLWIAVPFALCVAAVIVGRDRRTGA